MRSVRRLIGALAFLCLTLALASGAEASAAKGPCGRPYDAGVRHPYAIQATWMFPRDSGCEWQEVLEEFHGFGGRTVLQFAPALEKLAVSGRGQLRTAGGSSQSALGECRHADGATCFERAIEDLSARGIGQERIANWLFYESPAYHGNAILCPGDSLDRKIEVKRNGRVLTFWRLVLRHDDYRAACTYGKGTFDVLFVLASPTGAAQDALVEVADGLGMDVYFGAPAFSTVEGAEWQPDYDMGDPLMDWSRRVFADYAARYRAHASFKGVYQTFEVPLAPAWQGDGYDLYAVQAAVLHAVAPGRQYVVSPYFYVNKSQDGTDLAGTVQGFTRLARAGVDIIMPQDGRGTGKAALFWPWQRQQPVAEVDPQLANFDNVDGRGTFASQFSASTGELFEALRAAAAQLGAAGVAVKLWPNVEAFEEDRRDAGYAPCDYSDLSQTRKERLDRAITFAGPAARIASFMYDPLFTCSDRYGTSLVQQIEADHSRPIVVGAAFAGGSAPGIAVQGYHLAAAGTVFQLTWRDGDRTQTAQLPARRSQAGAGPATDTVWLDVDRSKLPGSGYLQILAVAADSRTAHEAFSLPLRTDLASAAQ